ncbi:unnamed protein product [Adineta steineri]|uniref:Uncharacterized protein n=1 Tax=Adineta steineri TaxID=433720 RepID=A0A814M0E1_9BILA|nr:unnamed protein product [Adineta steineri]CAF1480010.1 unnamed protein product [Adineta steineri]
MYQDAGYGENWQPAANNARRIDPYTRSCAALGGLFGCGFIIIVIIVLSLIPLYISHDSSTNSNIQAPKVTVTNYNLQFQSPFNNFNSQTILSDSTNLQTLQAALTSLVQTDPAMAGSVVEINTSSVQSRRKRRQTSNLLTITFNLNVISGKGCSSIACLNQFQSHATSCLTDINQTISGVRYQQSGSSNIYWLNYKLPQTMQSNATFVIVDSKLLSSLLATLTELDASQHQSATTTTPTTTTTNNLVSTVVA